VTIESSERQLAIAVHEAGHAVVMVQVGAPTPDVHLLVRTESDPGGFTKALGEWVAAERTDFLAVFYAGDIAVEEIYGDRLPEDTTPQSDRELLRKYERELGATEDEKLRAQRNARKIVKDQRKYVLAVAHAVLANPGNHLAAAELDELLAPIRDASRR
jgi:hypothetical protein